MDRYSETSFLLQNGVAIPSIGFGTFKIPDGEETYKAVTEALEVGYRHIDTAALYGNEASVGRAVRDSGIARSEIFITTKLWNDRHGYQNTLDAFQESLEKLQMSHIDLFLIHWPKHQNVESWAAMEELYSQGMIRAIGVSNFKEHHLQEIFEHATVKPMVNQIELHPHLSQRELVKYCQRHEIIVEAWSPIMRGRVSEVAEINAIAERHGKDAGQVTLRWHIQHGVIVLPKSVTPSRIASNRQLFDFELTSSEMSIIDRLDREERIGPDPDLITF